MSLGVWSLRGCIRSRYTRKVISNNHIKNINISNNYKTIYNIICKRNLNIIEIRKHYISILIILNDLF